MSWLTLALHVLTTMALSYTFAKSNLNNLTLVLFTWPNPIILIKGKHSPRYIEKVEK